MDTDTLYIKVNVNSLTLLPLTSLFSSALFFIPFSLLTSLIPRSSHVFLAPLSPSQRVSCPKCRLGVTRIQDLSHTDMKKVRQLALIDMTALCDLLELEVKRQKTSKRKIPGMTAPGCKGITRTSIVGDRHRWLMSFLNHFNICVDSVNFLSSFLFPGN